MTRSLEISANRRYLVRPDGTPFFYLGDTAWELFHRLTREEAERYLRDRAGKGFTVIQAVVLAELDGLHVPNPYGALPLIDDDPTRPNEAYFQQVDAVVAQAGALGLFVGMLPTWGDKVAGSRLWGIGPEIFTPENARVYGRFLGARYREYPIIWILGGDRPAETPLQRTIWRAMAEGLHEGDGGRHLITYHPIGNRSSAEFVHDEPWLDFDMIQSGHARKGQENYEMIAQDYARTPVKPVLDGEPRYEDHPVGWKPEEGWFDDYDVRQALYWGLLAGGCGITYGCHDIWQFWTPEREPISSARTPWPMALDLPGAYQAGYARALYESRPFLDLEPDQGVIAAGVGVGMDHAQAACAADGTFAFVYLPTGNPVVINTDRISATLVRASWFDPREQVWTVFDEFPNEGTCEFTPPSQGPGNDWVLVLDDASRGFPTG